MFHPYSQLAPGRRVLILVLKLWLLAVGTARAQAPAWSDLAFGSTSQASGASTTRAAATDASGNVFVTGLFVGTVTFGNTSLTSKAGSQDIFVAKYVPSIGIWAWALSGGGTGNDAGSSIAVSGNSVYVTGTFSNDAANSAAAVLGSTDPAAGATPLTGTSANYNYDLVLAKYTDQGTAATLSWAQVAGGAGEDVGSGVAVSGSSVYVTGYISNNLTNAFGVVFGGNGTTAGTSRVNGASTNTAPDMVLAKYTDNGTTGSYGWSQVGGGTDNDRATGVAASGSSVYVTGSFYNSRANAYAVVFGGGGTTAGTVPVNGATPIPSYDLVLAKYTDQGSTGALGWTQVAGSINNDDAGGVAVSGSSVYLTGGLVNDRNNSQGTVLGGGGTTPGTAVQYGTSASFSTDIVLAKYQDNGSTGTFQWSQVGGGTGTDLGTSVAVSGSSVYVVGDLTNNTADTNGAVFGGSGTVAGTRAQPGVGSGSPALQDIVLAKYQDNGSTGVFQWSQVGGSNGFDHGNSVAVSGQQVYAAGYVSPPAAFGAATLTSASTRNSNVLAYLTDPILLLPTRAAAIPTLALYPNPASGAAILRGATPGAAVQVLDMPGRVVATAAADAAGTTQLGGLPAGVYLVRAGAATARLVME